MGHSLIRSLVCLHCSHARSIAHSFAPELVGQWNNFVQFSRCPESVCHLGPQFSNFFTVRVGLLWSRIRRWRGKCRKYLQKWIQKEIEGEEHGASTLSFLSANRVWYTILFYLHIPGSLVTIIAGQHFLILYQRNVPTQKDRLQLINEE